MFLIEWGLWKTCTESEAARKAADTVIAPTDKSLAIDLYESELREDVHFRPVSNTPRSRGPIFALNETYMDMRCGGSEEKRGLITLMTLGGLGPMTYAWLHSASTCYRLAVRYIIFMLSMDFASPV